MQSPGALLQSALYESDETKRLQKAARACKIIADVLPFKEQNILLLEEDDILKHLLLASSLVPSSIDLIMTVMLQKFKLKDIFLRSFWQACDYIAGINEQSMKNIQSPRGNQLPVNKYEEITDGSIELTILLTKHAGIIKLTTLNYLEILMGFFVKDPRIPSYQYHLTQTPLLIRKYLENSNNDKVILKACKIMGMAKSFSFSQLSFEFEVEAILMAKKAKAADSAHQHHHHHHHQVQAPEEKKDESLHNGNNTNRENPEKMKGKQADPKEQPLSDDDCDSDSMDSEFRDQVLAEIETFLAQDGSPLIPKDQFMSHAVRSPTNIELLLALAVDPQSYSLDDAWEKYCPYVMEENALNKFLTLPQKRQEKFEFHLKNSGFHYRSFKVMQTLTESRNYRYIQTMNLELQDFFFDMAHESLTRNTIFCNMNHIVRIIEFFLSKNEDMALSYLLSMNFPFILINFLDFQLVQQGFLNLFNCSEKSFLSKSSQSKVYQYALRSKFFVDLVKMMLLGENSVDPKKTSQSYEPMGVPIPIESGNRREKLDYSTESDSLFNFAHHAFPELKQNFQPDIDRIKTQYFSSLEPSRKSRVSASKKNTMKFEVQKRNEDTTKLMFMGYEYDKIPKNKIEKLSKYPSIKPLWEKFLKDVEALQPPKEPNDEEVKKAAKNLRKPTKKLSTNQFRIKELKTPNGNTTMGRSVSQPRSLSRGTSMLIGDDNQRPGSPGKTSIQDIDQKLKHDSQKSKVGSLGSVNSPMKNASMTKYDEKSAPGVIQSLGSLYPLEMKDSVRTIVDKQAESSDFEMGKICENDEFPLMISELLHMMIRRMIENDQNGKMKELLKNQACDYSELWEAILGVDQAMVFEYLLKNYLFKIKIHHTKSLNSAYEAGESVNLILEHAESNKQIGKYFSDIHRISKKYFVFIMKQIIQSHSWTQKKDILISLQTLTLAETLGTARLQLVRTLYFILRIDKSQNYALLEKINDTCWHTLITWIFNYRTNNMYLNLMYSLLEMAFEHGSERLAITILIKLDLIIRMRNAMGEIYKNGVLLKELHIDNLLFFFRRVVKLIEKLQEKDYSSLKSQLTNSFSWIDLKQQLDPPPRLAIPESKTNIKSSKDTSPRRTPRDNIPMGDDVEEKPPRFESPLKPRLVTPSKSSSRFLTPQRDLSTRPHSLLPSIQQATASLTKKREDSPIRLVSRQSDEKPRSQSTKHLRMTPSKQNIVLESLAQKGKMVSPQGVGITRISTPSFKIIKLVKS